MKINFLFTAGVFLYLFVSPSAAMAQVVINEFSSATSSDWVEFYAIEDTDIDGWYLKDTASTKMKEFLEVEIIGPSTNQYLLVSVSNRLNKSGDTIMLYNSKDEKIDEITYGGQGNICLPEENGSIGRYPDANNTWERFIDSTEGASNNTAELYPCPSPTPEPTPKPTSTPKPTKTPKPSSTLKPTNARSSHKPPSNSAILGQSSDVVLQEDLLDDDSVSSSKEAEFGDEKREHISNRIEKEDEEQDKLIESDEETREQSYGAGFLMVGGLSFIVAAGYPIIRKKGLANVFSQKEKE